MKVRDGIVGWVLLLVGLFLVPTEFAEAFASVLTVPIVAK